MAMLSDQFGEPEQLRMFMTAREIHRDFAPADRLHGGIGPQADARIWNTKLQEAKDSGLESSVRRLGVTQPVDLLHSYPAVLNGQHRVAAAVHTNADQLVPVLHSENVRDFMMNSRHSNKAWPGRW